jgi:hypothetical protein
MKPTIESVTDLLHKGSLQKLDEEIATLNGVKVSRDHMDLFVKFAHNSLVASGMSPHKILSIIDGNPKEVTKLALKVLIADAEAAPEQEDGSVVLEQGNLAAGATVGYCIYFCYLRDADEKGLLKYLRAMRIPSARQFAADLQRYYQDIVHSSAT